MRTYLFGNGLSLAFDKDYYKLDNLSLLLGNRLEEMETKDGRTLGEEVGEIAKAFGQKGAGDFESLAGPIDTLSKVLLQLVWISSIAPDKQTKVALVRLSARLSRIYKQVVGVVLQIVTQKIGADWTPVNSVAKHLFETARTDGELDVFTLNYDSLLDSALLQVQPEYPGVKLMDEFDGRQIWKLSYTSGGKPSSINALAWREGQFLPPNPLRLHHLHGAATWINHEQDTHKATDLDEIRDVGLFDVWAKGGNVGLSPVVVLTDQKERIVGRAPFAEAYERLGVALHEASDVVIAGYAFRDLPLNRVLESSLTSKATVVVLNPSQRVQDRAAKIARSGGARLKAIKGKLPDALDDLKLKAIP